MVQVWMETFSLYTFKPCQQEEGLLLHPRIRLCLPTMGETRQIAPFAEAAAKAHRFHAILSSLGAQNRGDVPIGGCGQMVNNHLPREKKPSFGAFANFLGLIPLLWLISGYQRVIKGLQNSWKVNSWFQQASRSGVHTSV